MKEKLCGIDEISAFSEKDHSTLLNWRQNYGFPMERGQDGIWTASPAEIIHWFKERGCNPRTVSQSNLNKYLLKQAREAGTARLHGKKLNGANEISKFLNKPINLVLELLHYTGCPIVRARDMQLSVDADALEQWLDDLRSEGVRL